MKINETLINKKNFFLIGIEYRNANCERVYNLIIKNS